MEDLKSLTADSILEDDIFVEIFEQEDPIVKARMKMKLNDRAKELGVKTKFDELLTATGLRES